MEKCLSITYDPTEEGFGARMLGIKPLQLQGQAVQVLGLVTSLLRVGAAVSCKLRSLL